MSEKKREREREKKEREASEIEWHVSDMLVKKEERKKKREAFASLQELGEPSIRSLYSGYQIKTSLF